MDPRSTALAVFEDGWNREQFDGVAAALGTFRFHIGGTCRTMDLDDLRRIVRSWREGFSDLHFDVHSVVADGAEVAVRTTLRGTHDGRWRDLPATGRTIEIEHMFFFRFDGDRITDVWELLDRSLLVDQLTT